jgi:S1-C subfamily serine protease
MIGINSQIESPTGASAGVGFAIPVSIAKRIVPQLIRDGEIRRPKLGISPRDVESLGKQLQVPVDKGVVIVAIQPGSPAANAGLREVVQTEDGDLELGDIVVGIDGEKIDNNDDLYKALDKHKFGDTVNVEIYRKGRRTSVPVRLTEMPTNRRNGRE